MIGSIGSLSRSVKWRCKRFGRVDRKVGTGPKTTSETAMQKLSVPQNENGASDRELGQVVMDLRFQGFAHSIP